MRFDCATVGTPTELALKRMIWALGLSGCLVTAPPQAFHGAPTPTTATVDPTTSVDASVGSAVRPFVAVQHTMPVEGAGVLVADLRGQLGLSSVAATPGLWIRSRPDIVEGFHLGGRLGLASGLGDTFGVLAFRLPWVGPHLVLQAANGFGDGSAIAFSLMGEYTFPLATDYVVDGDAVAVFPGFYFGAHVSAAIVPNPDKLQFNVGGGLTSYSGWWITPVLTLGVRSQRTEK